MSSDFANKVLNTAVFRISGILLGFFSSVLLVRGLKVEEYGQYSYLIIILSTLSTILAFGQHASNVYYISRKKSRASAIISNTLFYTFFSSSIYILFYYFAGSDVFQAISGTDYPEELLGYSVYIFPVLMLVTLVPSILRGLYLIVPFNSLQLLIPLLKIIFFTLFIWLLDRKLSGAFEALFIVNLIVAVIALYIAIRKSGISYKLSTLLYGASFTYGSKAYLGELIGLAKDSLVIILLGYFFSFTELGLFVVAKNLIALVNTANQSIIIPLLPRLSRERTGNAGFLVKRVISFSIWASFLGVIVAGLVAPYFLPYIYGSAYVNSVKVFMCLLPMVLGMAIIDILTTYFMSVGKPVARVVINSLMFFLTLGPLIILSGFNPELFHISLVLSISTIITALFTLQYFMNISQSVLTWKNILYISAEEISGLAKLFLNNKVNKKI
jgi:O-antigen/teichoic acid export membrane protein